MTNAPKRPLKRRRLGRDERRRLILEGATRLFARSGLRGVSLDEIAAASGVTKPVLYDHFPSKEALYLSALERVRGELLALGAQGVETPGSPEARVQAALLGFFGYARGQPEAMRLLLSASGEAALDERAARIQDEVTDQLLGLFLSLLPAPPPSAEAARLRLQMEFIKQGLHGLAAWWPGHPEVTGEQLADSVLRVMWNGLARLFPEEKG